MGGLPAGLLEFGGADDPGVDRELDLPGRRLAEAESPEDLAEEAIGGQRHAADRCVDQLGAFAEGHEAIAGDVVLAAVAPLEKMDDRVHDVVLVDELDAVLELAGIDAERCLCPEAHEVLSTLGPKTMQGRTIVMVRSGCSSAQSWQRRSDSVLSRA